MTPMDIRNTRETTYALPAFQAILDSLLREVNNVNFD